MQWPSGGDPLEGLSKSVLRSELKRKVTAQSDACGPVWLLLAVSSGAHNVTTGRDAYRCGGPIHIRYIGRDLWEHNEACSPQRQPRTDRVEQAVKGLSAEMRRTGKEGAGKILPP
ncbi:hypothetical protein K0M31_016852 [Melipona bicolor]|uniref:Uncharacterized protein n=1 Tax=Melipona bicolor TaxID=60889 RepID=A0AA40KEJ0_9HYME|nr:hypothetical protein K0M31_016852 [Melipona bicolor]